jgi:hypothetical protein
MSVKSMHGVPMASMSKKHGVVCLHHVHYFIVLSGRKMLHALGRVQMRFQTTNDGIICVIGNAEILTARHFCFFVLLPRLRCNSEVAISRIRTDVEITSGRCRNGGCRTRFGAGRLPPSLSRKGFWRRQR